MKLFKKLFVASSLLLIVISCSTEKDAVLNRTFHAVKTKNNVFFNGEQAYLKGLQAISEKHQDNFWKRLPIEAITFNDDEIQGPKFNTVGAGFDDNAQESQPKNQTPFDRAEDKAAKAIQKHSMNIKGYEKNPKIDDAYLLLGKSRYYTQRFIPALEAYNYIIANYPKADLHYETRVWRSKANTRLGNEALAIQTMTYLLDILDSTEDVSDRVQEEAYTAMAMAYAETDTIQKVIDNLKLATKTFINKEQSARNMFVLGQIYSELNHKDSARAVFKKLADTRKAPRKYRVHANIELVKNNEADTTSTELIKRFKKLIRNSDNRKYLDELYYQIGVLEESRDSVSDAVEYYKKSALAKNGTDYQKTYTYERLGNINFKQENYITASSYYDSVMQIASGKYDDEKRIRRIKRKNKNLTTLRDYETLISANDSILDLVKMPNEDRIAFFESYVKQLKKEDEERRQQLLNAQNFGNQFGNSFDIGAKKDAKWYFYNMQSTNFGKNEFKRIWGNRLLEDNWRWSDKTIIAVEEEEEQLSNERYNIDTYLNAIPTEEEVLQKLKEDRNDALFQLGVLYKERFNNDKLAIEKLERLQAVNTDKKKDLAIHYHLYKLYERNNQSQLSNLAKDHILKNHADSRFAEIIKSPNKEISFEEEKEDSELLKKYKLFYAFYKDYQFEVAVEQIDKYKDRFTNSDLFPKLALLRALCVGKYQSKEAYQKELEYVAVSFADGEEGRKAQEILEILTKENTP